MGFIRLVSRKTILLNKYKNYYYDNQSGTENQQTLGSQSLDLYFALFCHHNDMNNNMNTICLKHTKAPNWVFSKEEISSIFPHIFVNDPSSLNFPMFQIQTYTRTILLFPLLRRPFVLVFRCIHLLKFVVHMAPCKGL